MRGGSDNKSKKSAWDQELDQMIQGSSGGAAIRRGSKGRPLKPATITWHAEKKMVTVNPDSYPEESDNNKKDSEKVEDVDGDVVKENGDKPQLLEDEVQRKQRKSPAIEENASKDDGDHV